MDSRPLRILLFVGLVILIIVTIVIVVVTLTQPEMDNASSDQACQRNRRFTIESFRRTHPMCENPLPLAKGCQDNPRGEWIWFERSSFVSDISDQLLLSSHDEDHPYVLLSPVYNVSIPSCSVQISVSSPSNVSSRLYIISPNINDFFVNMTTGTCQHYVIEDRELLPKLKSFQVIILSNLPLRSGELMGSVSSQSCYSYGTIEEESRITQNPSFAFVPRGTRNRCSLRVVNESVDCDWLSVNNLGNGRFIRQGYHGCVHRGATLRPEDNDEWFLSLSNAFHGTRAYIISPIIEGGTSHLLLSFWYISQCRGTKLKIYIIPSSRDVGGVTEEVSHRFELDDVDFSYKWIFTTVEIEIPKSYDTYQIVLEGILSERGNCSGHVCYITNGMPLNSPQAPMLALDEITLEGKFDRCNASANTGFLDCAFQDENKSSTVCAWTSAAPSNIPDNYKDLFAVWKLNKAPDRTITEAHLEGRGYVLTFQSQTAGYGNYVRSPVLVANDSCSCKMTFFFLLRGIFSPRLQVNILLGDDPQVSRVEDDRRPVFPQWSLFGHQSDDWVMADIDLNLPSSSPFQVEIRAWDIMDLQGGTSLDDIFFAGCDFRSYVS